MALMDLLTNVHPYEMRDFLDPSIWWPHTKSRFVSLFVYYSVGAIE